VDEVVVMGIGQLLGCGVGNLREDEGGKRGGC